MPNQKLNTKNEGSAIKKVSRQVRPVKVDGKQVVKKADSKSVGMSVSLFGIDGKVQGKISLPKEVFGQVINKTLLAQAVRVYQANKRQGNASTKTRAEVDGSSRKIYRQKGTGRARHGTLRAPIFVKGGIVHGPKPRDYSLDFPQKMRKKALFSALSAKFAAEEVRIIAGFEKVEAKTKQISITFEKLNLGKNSILLVVPDTFTNAKRASGNISNLVRVSSTRLNAFDVLKNKYVLIAKESIDELEKSALKKK